MICADSILRLYNKLLGNWEVYAVPELTFWNIHTFYVDSQGDDSDLSHTVIFYN